MGYDARRDFMVGLYDLIRQAMRDCLKDCKIFFISSDGKEDITNIINLGKEKITNNINLGSAIINAEKAGNNFYDFHVFAEDDASSLKLEGEDLLNAVNICKKGEELCIYWEEGISCDSNYTEKINAVYEELTCFLKSLIKQKDGGYFKMRAIKNKIILDLQESEGEKSTIIRTLDGSSRPQKCYGVVISVGEEVVGVSVGDIVITQIASGECYKDKDGKKYKSLEDKQVSFVMDASEIESAKQIVRI